MNEGPRSVTPWQREELRHRALGTQQGEYELLVDLPGGDVFDEGDVLEILLDENVDRCEECDTWVESSELVDDDGEYVGSCSSCRPAE